MNKEENFLKPVIRFVHWEKQNDLEKFRNSIEIDWPDVRMFLGYIKPEKFNELEAALIELQDLIPKIHFASLGISLNRDIATIDKSDFSINYELWLRNGVQSLSYFSPYIDDDIFSTKVLALKRLMLASLEEIDPAGWKERYDTPFDETSFDWGYNKINGR